MERIRYEIHVPGKFRRKASGSEPPFDSSPGFSRGSCSGFRPTGVVDGVTGLPVGLHIFRR